jgi:hypothetical protein
LHSFAAVVIVHCSAAYQNSAVAVAATDYDLDSADDFDSVVADVAADVAVDSDLLSADSTALADSAAHNARSDAAPPHTAPPFPR